MAEGGVMAELTREESDDFFYKRKIKAPSKKRLDDEVEVLMANIKVKEDELKCLQRRPQNEVVQDDGGERESLQTQLKATKLEKEAVLEKRKILDEKLKVINAQIAKKVDVVKKMQASLRYKTEEKINDAIRKFEYQLRVQNFRMAEEKRMVAEIDTLKRSKKCLREYLIKQRDIDTERKKQKEIKDERDHYFNTVAALKSKEDKVKQEIRKKKSVEDEAWTKYKESGQLRETLKKEIDDLYERKRRIVADFKRQQVDYHEKIKHDRMEQHRKKEEEKRLEREAQQREIDEYEASREPYEDEKVIISALIAYLHRSVNVDDISQSAGGDSTGDDSPVCSPVSTLQMKDMKDLKENDGQFRILRKKSADDFESMFSGGSGKRKKSSKKQRRNTWMSKPVKHSPETIAQFVQLGISAPSHVGEIALVIEQLNAKKEYYENLPPKPRRMLSKVEEERLQNSASALQQSIEGGQCDASDIHRIESGQFDDAYESEQSQSMANSQLGTTPQEVNTDTQSNHGKNQNQSQNQNENQNDNKQTGDSAINTADRDSLNNVIKNIGNVSIEEQSVNSNNNTCETLSSGCHSNTTEALPDGCHDNTDVFEGCYDNAIETVSDGSHGNTDVSEGCHDNAIETRSDCSHGNTNENVSDGCLEDGDESIKETTKHDNKQVTNLQDFRDTEERVQNRVDEIRELKRKEALDSNETFTDAIVNSYNFDKMHHGCPAPVALQESL